jgi:hypothetical protein
MLQDFHRNSPDGRLDKHPAQGRWEGDVEQFPYKSRNIHRPRTSCLIFHVERRSLPHCEQRRPSGLAHCPQNFMPS